jgi:hypothetical protein
LGIPLLKRPQAVRLFTDHQAAAYLGCGRTTIYNLVAQGELFSAQNFQTLPL